MPKGLERVGDTVRDLVSRGQRVSFGLTYGLAMVGAGAVIVAATVKMCFRRQNECGTEKSRRE